MKQKFALLTIVGALLALAVPASSSASMYPANAKFEFGGTGAGPRLTTSLGSCTLKVTGQVPAAPANEATALSFTVTPSVSSCSSGLSATLSGEWKLAPGGGGSGVAFILASYNLPPDAVVLRSTTLPGCKLTTTNPNMVGTFNNGLTTPKALTSAFHAHGNPVSYTWANDGGTCAIAGSKEVVTWESSNSTVPVKNLTTPATPIIVAG